MRLFEHPDFDQAILQATDHFQSQGLRPAIIEKDYYVTYHRCHCRLFFTNQLLIATSFDEARVGTIGGLSEHFSSWKTVAPSKEENVAAADMLRHYVTNILPNGYKAQVVAYSRLAAVRYVAALQTARAELLTEADALSPEDKAMDDEALCQRPPKVQAIVQAWRYRDALKKIEFATVISGGNNDDPAWKPWTDAAASETRIKRFKKPLFHTKPEKTDALAFLIVKSMLLTGFDAPIEGVMYLDRPIREAELLQAIARVNRTGFGKRCGIVVDYYGVAQHLKEALAAYANEDIQGALQSLKDEVPALRDRHLRVVDLFRSRGIESFKDIETCVEVLEDEKLRAEFTVKLKQFLGSLDTVLPRPEGFRCHPTLHKTCSESALIAAWAITSQL